MIRGPQVWPESFNKWGDEVSANVGGSGADFGNGTDCDRSPLFRATTPLLRVVVHLRDTCWTQVIDTTHTHTHIQNETEKKQKKKKKRWWRRSRASKRERERKEKKHLAILPFLFQRPLLPFGHGLLSLVGHKREENVGTRRNQQWKGVLRKRQKFNWPALILFQFSSFSLSLSLSLSRFSYFVITILFFFYFAMYIDILFFPPSVIIPHFASFWPIAARWRSRSLHCCQMSTNQSEIRCNLDTFFVSVCLPVFLVLFVSSCSRLLFS